MLARTKSGKRKFSCSNSRTILIEPNLQLVFSIHICTFSFFLSIKANILRLFVLRKDHVHQEETASKKWPENWGFMTQRYDDVSL